MAIHSLWSASMASVGSATLAKLASCSCALDAPHPLRCRLSVRRPTTLRPRPCLTVPRKPPSLTCSRSEWRSFTLSRANWAGHNRSSTLWTVNAALDPKLRGESAISTLFDSLRFEDWSRTSCTMTRRGDQWRRTYSPDWLPFIGRFASPPQRQRQPPRLVRGNLVNWSILMVVVLVSCPQTRDCWCRCYLGVQKLIPTRRITSSIQRCLTDRNDETTE